MLNLELDTVWCRRLGTLESRSEIPTRFSNVVLEKDGEVHFDRLCEEKVLHRVKENSNILHTIKGRETGLVIF